MLIEHTKFYYYVFSEEKKRIFKQIYDGIKARSKTIEIETDKRRISAKDFVDIVQAVYNDIPSFYYFDAIDIQGVETASGYFLKPKYLYSDEAIAQYDARLMKGIESFKRACIHAGMSDYEKELIIHDYLVRNVSYDNEVVAIKDGDICLADESYNILGALLKKRAVCWGISCAFKLLCDACGLKSIVVVGSTENEKDPNHAWNIVKINNVPYHVDVTWDIKKKGDISFCYDYFNLNDHLMSLDHRWDRKLYPSCQSVQDNYYYKHRLFVKRITDIVPFIQNKVSSGERYIVFKFAVDDMPEKAKIAKAIQDALSSATLPLPNTRKYSYLVNEKTHNIYLEIKT